MPDNGNNTAQLREILEKCRGERHAVLMQDYPDPDAISCAFAYKVISRAFDIESDILFTGRVSHQENVALVKLLGIDIQWVQLEDLSFDRWQGFVLVDGQGTTTILTEPFLRAGIKLVAIVDHHSDQEQQVPLFSDLRPVGACASIFANYIEQELIPFSPAEPEHQRLATALMHGIVSETGSMIRAMRFDFNAAAFLQPFTDTETLVEILHQKRSHRVMEVIRLALAERSSHEGFCLSGVGYIRSDDRDAIPQAADFLISEENVHTAIVYGMVQKNDGSESIHGSLRTTKITLSPDAFLKEALGRMADGRYYGGGKESAGGFEIPLGFLSGGEVKDLNQLKWQAYSAMIRRKFLVKIGIFTE